MEKIVVSCIHCREVKSVRGIYTHVDRAHLKLTKYSSGNNGSYALLKQRASEKNTQKEQEYCLNPSKCKQCSNDLPFEKRDNNFCNTSCSAIYTNARKDYTKIKTGPVKKSPKLYKHLCKFCGIQFENAKKHQECCSNRCSIVMRNANARSKRSALANYRADCAFKFSLKDYPDEFDFSLIESHGWYKAKNHGNNLTGVSRDHMISVRYGFDNNIPAEHLSHPANCKLVTQSENSSKRTQNSITYEELLSRIDKWNKKYTVML